MGLPCYEILCSGILNVPLPYGMRLKVSPELHHIFKQLLGSLVRKWSFDGTAFASGFLKNKGRRSQYWNETGLWRNALLVNQKKNGSCKCVCGESRVERSSGNDVTCFSNRCCNVVGHLIETALWPLSFVWKVLGGRVSPKKTQGSP